MLSDRSWPISAFGQGPAGTWPTGPSLLVTNSVRNLQALVQQGLAQNWPKLLGELTNYCRNGDRINAV